MTVDTSWAAGIHETAKMSSIPGLPTRGSDVTVLITRVHLHPLCVLVEFWAKFSQKRAVDYEHLAKDIQSPGHTFKDLEGNPGDQCLVQINDTWHRCRIVSRNGSKYKVFLIDRGMPCSATTSELAWGRREHFQLPPEVEFCVLANVLPLSLDNRWSPVALEFMKSLPGKSVTAHVQDVLVPHRTILLHIPCIAKQMYEMGFSRKLTPDMFHDFVLMTLQSHRGTEMSPEIKQLSMGAGERLHKQELFMYPELLSGTVENVIVTEVTNPQRIFCQLKVFSQELKKLSEQITQTCEGRISNCLIGPEMIGFPCAARGSDGRWYRSVLQQVFPTNKMVEVLNVDCGTKQLIQIENVRPLAAEFFRMPVVTYICSLHGVIDKGVGWTTSQIDYLRSLLLHKTMIAKFEYQSISEGVHYITLYGDDNTNMNTLFGSKENRLLECEKTLEDYAIHSTAYSSQCRTQQEKKMLTPVQGVEKGEGMAFAEPLPAEDLPLNSSHVAVVQHVSSPSEFWIQTQNYTKELNELMDGIYHLYKDSANKDAVRNPTVGLYCAAKAEDGDFYRATVAEVGEAHFKVFFVDYGNTEVIEKSNIRTLPAKFKRLPRLALKCTLAGVRPKDRTWSPSASEFFSKAVTDKVLNVHVREKYSDSYVVQLTNPTAQKEHDVSALMCHSGHAERAETQRQSKAKLTMQSAIISPSQPSDAPLPGVYQNSAMSFQTQKTGATFKEHMFSIGSVLDVSVSYIESPNDFWCQLVQNAGHLKLLMHDIQAYYTGSEFQPNVENACIARHPDNGLWYRALVIHKHKTPQVDVLFVDYGQTDTVSLYDLRRICPEFLTLNGQAFRCSLLNPINPTSSINEWNKEAIESFQNFVETAVADHVILKCTIYAVMYSEQKIVFNIVDLETPFESICIRLVNLVKSVPPKKTPGASFRLESYYYSTHNVKTGTEEMVTVTCVNSVSQFYCQLEKNADILKLLEMKVSNLCHQLENVKLPTVFGTLCFAKYTDGKWYRGQIKATKPALVVHFVDYGDTIEVDKSDLLPVPREANDIMSVPMQSVVCHLSDVPANVPNEVNSWFETNATECKFRALVVAREPDGKLLVELYHGKSQINAKIKKMFQIEMQAENEVVYQGRKALDASGNRTQKTPKTVPMQAAEMVVQTLKKNSSCAPKPLLQMKDERKSTSSVRKPTCHVRENGQKGKSPPLELYKPPHQRQSNGRMTSNGSEPAGTLNKPIKENLPSDPQQLIKSKSPCTESEKENKAEQLPKLADLPSKSITSGMTADVYVSHCNSPLSFYVQCVREEDEIFSLVDKLNDPKSALKTINIKEVHPGDLVQAEFADDDSWYRAVVREIHSNAMALVEFVDFGNTVMMPISKLGRLHKSFLQLPTYSTHCMLSDPTALGKEEVIDPEVVSAFKEDVCVSGEKVFQCEFIRQMGSVWEVNLKDNGANIVCKVPATCPEIPSEKLKQVKEEPAQISNINQVQENVEKTIQNPCSLHYPQQEFLKGQQLEVYVTIITDAQTFWCQSANSEELNKITSAVSEVGDAANHKPIDSTNLFPASPCIALFSDDQLWYRAEVISKDGDKMSVLFVDYGNKSQVNITDVREMTPLLVEIPPQAFLCQLEGFDTSCGCWDGGALEELSTLTADKLLQLTVTGITTEEEKIKYLVRVECEGQVINKVMKTWWKCFPTEDKNEGIRLPVSCEPCLQQNSAVNEAALPEEPLEQPDVQDTVVTITHPKGPHSEEHCTEEIADEVPIFASSPINSESSKDAVHPESFIKAPEEESANIILASISAKDIFPCDSGIEENMLPSFDNKDGQAIMILHCNKNLVETDKDLEEESFSGLDTVGPNDLSSLLDENLVDAIDGSEVATSDKEFLPGVMDSYSFHIMNSSDAPQEGDDKEAAVVGGTSLTRTTAVKMVPRKAVSPRESTDPPETTDAGAEVTKQIEAELVLPSPLLPAQQLCDAATEQDMEAGDGFAHQEVTCDTTQVENDSISEEEASAHDEDTHSALLTDADTAASDPQTYTAPSPETGDESGEVTCCVEESQSTDVCTDGKEFSDENEVTRVGDDHLSSVAAEETITCITVPQEDVGPEVKEDLTPAEKSKEVQDESLEPFLGSSVELGDSVLQDELLCTFIHTKEEMVTEDETSDPHEDTISAWPSDTEPQTCTVPAPDLRALVEEVTCLVGEICLTDVCQDGRQEAETVTEDSDTLLQQIKECDDSGLTEEVSSLAEDSYEAQLSKITHLSLIIVDGSADVLPAEQQSEE